MTRQFVAVRFNADSKRIYTYHNDGPPVRPGQMVDVEGRPSLEVIEVTKEKPAFETKPILGLAKETPDKADGEADLPPKDHNQPPPYDDAVLEDLSEKVRDFTDGAGDWSDLKEIETEEQSAKLTDYLSGARGLYKKVDEARKAAKKPHDDAGKAVQDAFMPLLNKLKRSADTAKELQTVWLTKLEKEKAAERQRQIEEAERQRRAAEEAARQAESRNDIEGQVDAEAAMKEAEKAEKAAQRDVRVSSKSSTGGGRTTSLRTVREAEITNLRHLFLHYQSHPEVAEVLRRLANADIRAAKGAPVDIPGINIIERKVAA